MKGEGFKWVAKDFHDEMNFAVEKGLSQFWKRLIVKKQEDCTKPNPGFEQFKNQYN